MIAEQNRISAISSYNWVMKKITPEELIGPLLIARGMRLAVAESCTGGLIGHRITNVSGSSQYYLGSVTAYAYEAKVRLLGVQWKTLEVYGAVSRETVLEMARGIRRAFEADIGLAISGIAGPGGASPGKPVGLTWIGFNSIKREDARRFVWDGDRLAVKEQSAEAALNLLLEHLEQTSADSGGEVNRNPIDQSEARFLPVEVLAKFDSEGLAIPVSFTWEGIAYTIESLGRRWEDTNSQHMLVMVAGIKVFEMIYAPGSRRWYVRRPSESSALA